MATQYAPKEVTSLEAEHSGEYHLSPQSTLTFVLHGMPYELIGQKNITPDFYVRQRVPVGQGEDFYKFFTKNIQPLCLEPANIIEIDYTFQHDMVDPRICIVGIPINGRRSYEILHFAKEGRRENKEVEWVTWTYRDFQGAPLVD